MADKAISELPATTALANTDDLVINQDAGGGAYNTKRIAVSAFKSGLGFAPIASSALTGRTTITNNSNADGEQLGLRNNSTGAGAYTSLNLGNSSSNNRGVIIHTGGSFSPTGMMKADALYIAAFGAGGITLNADVQHFGIGGNEVMRVRTGGVNLKQCVIGSNFAATTGYVENTFAVNHPGGTGMTVFDVNATAGSHHIDFISSGHIMGNISNNANAATSYNTTSDERLKNFDVLQRDIGAMIDAIIVRDAEFLANPGDRVLSVSAQQLAASGYSEGVTYPERTRVVHRSANGAPVVDESGAIVYRDQTDEEAENNYWSAEYGRLGILALWGVKELRARVAALEALVDVTDGGFV